jgi:hypothetical protein
MSGVILTTAVNAAVFLLNDAQITVRGRTEMSELITVMGQPDTYTRGGRWNETWDLPSGSLFPSWEFQGDTGGPIRQ